jgi:hypothetical protein
MNGRCTGPRTVEGKAKSSMNALKHGLAARTPLIPGEDEEEFKEFVWDVVEDLRPQGPVQAELAQRVAVLMWKRRRLAGAEEQALCELRERYAARTSRRLAELEEAATTDEDLEELERERAREEENGARWDANQVLADQFGFKPGGLDRLARYEQRISQQIDSALRLLLKLQNRTQWQEKQDSSARAEAHPQGQQRTDTAPAGGTAAASAAADGGSAGEAAPAGGAITTPPHAPAQNELSAGPVEGREERPRGAWRAPPGAN